MVRCAVIWYKIQVLSLATARMIVQNFRFISSRERNFYIQWGADQEIFPPAPAQLK